MNKSLLSFETWEKQAKKLINLLCNDENKNEEIKLLNINDTEKNDKPKNNNIISFSIEDEITDNNDAPKLIEPIIIW